jgi:hypothetical protein
MKRREFITLLGGAAAYALLLPRAGRAQQPARRQLIGFLAVWSLLNVGFLEHGTELSERLGRTGFCQWPGHRYHVSIRRRLSGAIAETGG